MAFNPLVEGSSPSRPTISSRFDPPAGVSRPVHSPQSGVHPALDAHVRRHRSHRWRQPLHPGSVAAWATFRSWHRPDRPLLLDAGCGTGVSTLALAERHPHAQVVGVDRSAARLARAPAIRPGNVLLLRARLEDFWRLLDEAGTRLAGHYLLYPNPWPKPRHLGRRWHAHPVFPSLLALGGRLELRTNWRIYAEEFSAALTVHGVSAGEVVSLPPGERSLTPFERKYSASGHAIYRVLAEDCAASEECPVMLATADEKCTIRSDKRPIRNS